MEIENPHKRPCTVYLRIMHKNTKGIFHRTRIILKFVWEHKRPGIAKAIEKEELEVPQSQISRYMTTKQ